MNLKGNPFYLNDEGISWVKNTIESMSIEEKVGQLFCLHGDSDKEEELLKILNDIKPGGIMYRPCESTKIRGVHKFLQDNSKIPMLIAANLESGGDGIGNDGTFYGREIQVAASNDDKYAYRLGVVAGKEGAAVGCNWSFSPVVDIDMNYSNPITNVRTFGNNHDRVLSMAKEYMRGCQENEVAVSIKHFPGDGVDDRDQHLVTSVNSLSYKEWKESFGKVYKGMIEAGAKTVMAGHIMFPAYVQESCTEKKDEAYLPATMSSSLLQGLLRKELGFEGLIVTDASNMAGLTSSGKREDIVPGVIAAGCDMLLFTRCLEEDYDFMMKGVRDNVISKERLDEAVTRILALKASLNLHLKQQKKELVPPVEALKILKCDEHVKWARELSDASITLVKDTQNIIPISPKKYKNVLVIVLGDVVSSSGKPPVSKSFMSIMNKEGFNIIPFDVEKHGMLLRKGSIKELKETFDLVIYFANIKTASNQTTVRINWLPPMGLDMPWFVNEVPTIFISMANPYHLQDVPMVRTYINAYTANEYNPEVVVDKLVGRSEFKGVNPINPFCRYEDAKR